MYCITQVLRHHHGSLYVWETNTLSPQMPWSSGSWWARGRRHQWTRERQVQGLGFIGSTTDPRYRWKVLDRGHSHLCAKDVYARNESKSLRMNCAMSSSSHCADSNQTQHKPNQSSVQAFFPGSFEGRSVKAIRHHTGVDPT